MNDLISVIIPVYKVEGYLSKCIESVINQTYSNIEIILVDDGSPDNCGKICDEYAKMDNRIIVIHKENGGLSDARNAGTEIASGEFITYIDSDDWVNLNYIEILYSTLKNNNADISIVNYKRVSDESVTNEPFIPNAVVFDRKEATEEMLYQTSFDTSACCKLYRTCVMKEILYPIGKWYEDLFTTYRIIAICDKIAFVNAPIYYYRNNPNSIMNSHFDNRMFDEIEAVNQIVEYVENNMPDIKKAAYSRKYSSYSQVFRWLPRKTDDVAILEKKNEIWQFLVSYRKEMMRDKRARKKNRIAALITYLGKNIYRSI